MIQDLAAGAEPPIWKAPALSFIRIWICACLIAVSPIAVAQEASSKAEIVKLLGRMHEFVPVEYEFRSMGFADDNLDLAMAQYRRMFNDPGIAGYVADRLIAAHEGKLPDASQAGGLLGPLIDRGIGHLPTRDLVYFYKVESTVFGAMSARDCGLAVKQRLSPRRLSDATARAAARLNTPALKEYYRIQFRAARLGLSHRQATLSPAREERIEQLIGERVFEASDDARSRSLIQVFDDPDHASNRQACEAGRLIMDTVLQMKGRNLRDALIYFSSP